MALDLGDLDEYFDASMLVKIKGKQYRIPPVAAELGLWARRVAARGFQLQDLGDGGLTAAAAAIAETEGPLPIPEGMSIEEAMLSAELVKELIADGVADEAMKHLSQVVFIRMVAGDEFALHVARGDDPKATAPNRAQRRAAKKASASKTTSTAAGTTTRKPASGSGTKSPRGSAAPAKAASRGRKS